MAVWNEAAGNGKGHGGIMVLVKEKEGRVIQLEKTDSNKQFIWLKIVENNTLLRIAACYFAPQVSKIYKKCGLDHNDPYAMLKKDVAVFSRRGDILLIGDFNARTANWQASIFSSEVNDNPIWLTEERNHQWDRISEDDKGCNHFGEELITLCGTFDLIICNGLARWAKSGNFTCNTYNGASVVDYVICSQNLYKNIGEVEIGEHIWDLKSDNRPLWLSELDKTKGTAVLTTIDLSNPDLAKSASLIRQTCLDSGFFYVINHGVPQELFDDLFQQSRKFFELPLEEKMKALRDENFRGYTPLEDQKLDPSKQTKGDCKEGYYIGVEVGKDDPQATKPFTGSNVWPSAEFLPDWRQTMEKYFQEALNVGRKIARLIALALNLNANFFDKPEILEQPLAVLRLLHYVDEASNPEFGIYGAGAHSDFGLLTLLVTDEVSGLQICKNKDAQPQTWEDVHPLKGAFIVNIGDMLERWSNNIFRSTMHRVLLSGKERYSVAFFVEPGPDCHVECLPTCHSETNPPRYPPVKYGDYLAQRYKDTFPAAL